VHTGAPAHTVAHTHAHTYSHGGTRAYIYDKLLEVELVGEGGITAIE